MWRRRSAISRPRGRRRAPLGILVVHGIGQQRRGETLTRAVDAILEHFDSRPGSAGSVELQGAVLKPESGPARARLRFGRSPVDGSVVDRSWLFAESWWAESFLPGRFGDMVGWAVRLLPHALLAHVATELRRQWRAFLKARALGRVLRLAPLSVALLQLALAPLAALVVMAVLVLLSVLALIPWAPLRTPAEWLQARLAATLGDSAILLSSKTNRAAMVGKVRADVRWLAERCRRVAVVAHSQGAALSWEALSTRGPRRARDLRTFGSGLRKVLQSDLEGRPARRRAGWAWSGALAQVALVTLAYWLYDGLEPGTDQAALLTLVAGVVLFFLGFAPGFAVSSGKGPPTGWELALPGLPAFSLALTALLVWWFEPGWRWVWAAGLAGPVATVGVYAVNGLSKRSHGSRRGRDRVAMAAAILAGVGLALATIWLGDGLLVQAVVGLVAVAGLLLLVLADAVTGDPVDWQTVNEFVAARRVHWRDWYASHDPVPVGKLDPLGDASVEVTNRGQVLGDHTSYWQNRDEFVADLAASLARSSGWPLPEVGPEVKARRRWRVRLLRASSRVAWAAIPIALALRWSRLAALGESAAGAAARLLGALPFELGADLFDPAGLTPELAAAIGGLVTVAPILLLKSAIAWWWRRLDRKESLLSIAGQPYVAEHSGIAFLWPLSFYLAAIILCSWPQPLPLTRFVFLVAVGGAGIGASVLHQLFEKLAPPAPRGSS